MDEMACVLNDTQGFVLRGQFLSKDMCNALLGNPILASTPVGIAEGRRGTAPDFLMEVDHKTIINIGIVKKMWTVRYN